MTPSKPVSKPVATAPAPVVKPVAITPKSVAVTPKPAPAPTRKPIDLDFAMETHVKRIAWLEDQILDTKAALDRLINQKNRANRV